MRKAVIPVQHNLIRRSIKGRINGCRSAAGLARCRYRNRIYCAITEYNIYIRHIRDIYRFCYLSPNIAPPISANYIEFIRRSKALGESCISRSVNTVNCYINTRLISWNKHGGQIFRAIIHYKMHCCSDRNSSVPYQFNRSRQIFQYVRIRNFIIAVKPFLFNGQLRIIRLLPVCHRHGHLPGHRVVIAVLGFVAGHRHLVDIIRVVRGLPVCVDDHFGEMLEIRRLQHLAVISMPHLIQPVFARNLVRMIVIIDLRDIVERTAAGRLFVKWFCTAHLIEFELDDCVVRPAFFTALFVFPGFLNGEICGPLLRLLPVLHGRKKDCIILLILCFRHINGGRISLHRNFLHIVGIEVPGAVFILMNGRQFFKADTSLELISCNLVKPVFRA